MSQSYKVITSCKTANSIPATIFKLKEIPYGSKYVKNQSMNWIKDSTHFTFIQSNHLLSNSQYHTAYNNSNEKKQHTDFS